MRKVIVLSVLLALLLVTNQSTVWSQNYEEGELLAWQAIAESYYTPEGLANENFFFEAPALVAAGEIDVRWARAAGAVQPGMILPDFTLLDMDGVAHSLSDYRGKAFILLNNGSWY